jgi:hypothetical protein
MNKQDALTLIADYIIETEYDPYVSFCEENELDPKDINGLKQLEGI